MHAHSTLIKLGITLVLLVPFAFLGWSLAHKKSVAVTEPPLPLLALTAPTPPPAFTASTSTEKPDKYALFLVEAYDKIMFIHWKSRTEAELTDLFVDAYVAEVPTKSARTERASHDRAGFINLLIADFIPRKDAEKKRIAVAVVTHVLAHLEPLGRNQLMSEEQRVALRQTVSNINPSKDLYADIGVPKGAAPEVVAQKFETEKTTLEASSAPEAKVELAKITYADNVLTNVATKARYDTNLIEPTVFGHEIGSDLLYLYIEKISPTTMQEFGEALDRASSTKTLNRLVIDLRGNIGGALDFPLSFFGSYVGKGEGALELTHRDATWTEQTITPKDHRLDRFTTTVVITDKGTQSTAEAVTAYFKKKKLAIVVGDKTAGWGTVENTYPMTTEIDPNVKYTLYLVNSLTVADDGKPIQGRGVEPNVNVTEAGWDTKMLTYFKDVDFIKTLVSIMTAPAQR